MSALRVILPGLLVAVLAVLVLSWQQERRMRALVKRRLEAQVASLRHARETELGEPPLPANWLDRQLFRAQMNWRALATLGLAMLPVPAAARMLVGLSWVETAMLLPILAGVVALVVRLRITRRLDRLHEALPVFLDRLRQQILVGASVPQALQRAVAVSPPVIHWVFEPVERRVQAGGELVEALEWAARRHGGEGLASVAAAVSASLRYGGRLSEGLANLARMERMRLQVHQEMRAATAEVRASSLVLALLPLGVALFLFTATPGYAAYFFDPARGRTVLHVVIGLYLLGLFLLRQIARPRF